MMTGRWTFSNMSGPLCAVCKLNPIKTYRTNDFLAKWRRARCTGVPDALEL